MEYSYKFRLYPTKVQEEQIAKNFGCCRFVYNYFLKQRQEIYRSTGKAPTHYQQSRFLTGLKKELQWLNEADDSALRKSLRNLDDAYTNFFRRVKQGDKPGYPKFKSKHDNRQSYKSQCVRNNIKVFDKSIQLPKLGRVECRISKQVRGRILSATVSRAPSGKYFVALCCTDVEMPQLPLTGNNVGVDMGIKSIAITSDGVEYPNHKYSEKSQKKLVKFQRQFSRKTKGSNRRNKARLKLARIYEKVTNQRVDSLHKLTTELVRKYDVICIEDLVPSNMVKNHRLAKAISDVSWYELRRQFEYKANWYGKKVVVIDRFFPSSQLCSQCGYKWAGTKNLAVRKWTCPNCGASHDRDINAAINIKDEGLRIIA